MSEKELEALEWIIKLNEKVTLLLLKIKDHSDITEEDYDILKLWHRSWWLGLHPLYRTCVEAKTETAVQGGLFDDKTADNPSGTNVEEQVSET